MIWAVVPLKELSHAKRRLSRTLTRSQRRQLMQAMVQDVLEVVTNHSQVAQTILLSNEPYSEYLTQHYNAFWWREPQQTRSLDEANLNTAVNQAAKRLGHYGVESMLVVHADLPLIDPQEIHDLIDQHHQLSRPALSIVSDHVMRGSNCLIATPPTVIEYQYGQDSLQKHLVGAEQSGASANAVYSAKTSRDVDTLDDLVAVNSLAATHSNHTTRYLQSIPQLLGSSDKRKSGT